MALQTQRKSLRQHFLQVREEVFLKNPGVEEQINARLTGLLSALNAEVVGAYSPTRGEPCVFPSLRLWLQGKKERCVALPRIDTDEVGKMHYAKWDMKGDLAPGRFGIAIPKEDCRAFPSLLLIPCVAFSETGYRLGYGGGYFDRYLAQNKGVLSVGVAYDEQKTDAFVATDFDKKMDYVVTQSRVLKCCRK